MIIYIDAFVAPQWNGRPYELRIALRRQKAHLEKTSITPQSDLDGDLPHNDRARPAPTAFVSRPRAVILCEQRGVLSDVCIHCGHACFGSRWPRLQQIHVTPTLSE